MSHDTHFLGRLERLSDAEVNYALALYRNVPLVREVVAKTAPPGTARVAIAISEEPEGAHILVERDGFFVTCLAAGMKHDLPVISREAVDRARRDHATLRLAFEAVARLQQDPDYVGRTLRLGDGPRVSREDIHELMQWAPALSLHFVEQQVDAFKRYSMNWGRLGTPESFKPKHERALRNAWLYSWEVGHAVGPAVFHMRRVYGARYPNERRFFRMVLPHAGLDTRLVGSTLRTVWTAASLGDLTLEDAVGAWAEADETLRYFAAALSLPAIGLRFPSLRARARAALDAPSAIVPNPDDEDLLFRRRLVEALEHPERALERHLQWATEDLRAWIGDTSDLDAPTILASSLYDEQPIFGFERMLRLADATAFVAASEFEDLYLPKAVLDRLPPHDPFESASRFARLRLDGTPAKAPPAPSPGRNETCPCGSGVKFKRCHGK